VPGCPRAPAHRLARTLEIAHRWGTPGAIGQALRVQGRLADGSEAIDSLREAVELLGRSPVRLEHASALIELVASGIRLRRKALTGVDSLTPSERRIAERAATDATNAEIAQALFVTVKTVEMHLTHAYRKLDITRRTQLRQALDAR
jgi:DNA-binding CsgD family transcriptional regulator